MEHLKPRAVFQYLLVHQDRPTRRDVLMALQWPEHSHNSARNNLNVALYSLRNTLEGLGHGVRPILYRDGCYSLNPDLTWWIDRTEFLSAVEDAGRAHRADRPRQVIAAYRKAIGLYRGPLFEDDGASEWYLPEQRRLKTLRARAGRRGGDLLQVRRASRGPAIRPARHRQRFMFRGYSQAPDALLCIAAPAATRESSIPDLRHGAPRRARCYPLRRDASSSMRLPEHRERVLMR